MSTRFAGGHEAYAAALKHAQELANSSGLDVAIRRCKEYGKDGLNVSFACRNDSDYARAEIVRPASHPASVLKAVVNRAIANGAEIVTEIPVREIRCKVCGELSGGAGSSMYGSVHKYGPTEHAFEPEVRNA